MLNKQNNFAYLLIALVIYLVVIPIADEYDMASGKVVRLISYSILLLIGVWSLQGSGKIFRTAMVLVVAGMIFNLIAYLSESTGIAQTAAGLVFAFLTLALLATLKQVIFRNTVDANRLYGAVCAYLLLGVIWALAYLTLYEASPDAFRGVAAESDPAAGVQWIYYSFVTLTTLGYGDITPVSASARVLAYSQAIFGVFYMAILVAGLVGVYISEQMNSRD